MLIKPPVVFTFTCRWSSKIFSSLLTHVKIKYIFTLLCSYFFPFFNSGDPRLSNTQHGDPGSSFPYCHLHPYSLCCRFYHCLCLFATVVVLGRTWRRPAAEGEEGHIAAFWAARCRPGLLLLRENFGRRLSFLNGGDSIFFWRPCRRRFWTR
jgi:hypothetical protein